MGYKLFCVMCGTAFENEHPCRVTCSDKCEAELERQTNYWLYGEFERLVPKACEVIGIESIDEYPAWLEEQKRGYVYFIRAGDDGNIKIGFSKDVDKRMADLQVASPLPLILVGTISGTTDDERGLHERFGHLREMGEWFAPGADLLEYIGERCEN